ncbi:hypothetical protein V8F06_013037 [Rhypophila decipiens]
METTPNQHKRREEGLRAFWKFQAVSGLTVPEINSLKPPTGEYRRRLDSDRDPEAKQLVYSSNQSSLFNIARRMPKGAHLHIHFNANLMDNFAQQLGDAGDVIFGKTSLSANGKSMAADLGNGVGCRRPFFYSSLEDDYRFLHRSLYPNSNSTSTKTHSNYNLHPTKNNIGADATGYTTTNNYHKHTHPNSPSYLNYSFTDLNPNSNVTYDSFDIAFTNNQSHSRQAGYINNRGLSGGGSGSGTSGHAYDKRKHARNSIPKGSAALVLAACFACTSLPMVAATENAPGRLAIPGVIPHIAAGTSIASSFSIFPLRNDGDLVQPERWLWIAYTTWGVSFFTLLVCELFHRRPMQRKLLVGTVLLASLNLLGSLKEGSSSALEGVLCWGPMALTASLLGVPVIMDSMGWGGNSGDDAGAGNSGNNAKSSSSGGDAEAPKAAADPAGVSTGEETPETIPLATLTGVYIPGQRVR